MNVEDLRVPRRLSNEEACARLELLQLRKAKYQEKRKGLESAANDFSNYVYRLNQNWSEKRLDLALVNHLLKMRCINTAYNFAVKSGIEVLFDFETFREADRIMNALRNKDFHPAKAWCDANAPWEYIEFVRRNQKTAALAFAWKHQRELWEIEKRVRQVLAVVAFGCDTQVLRHKKLFDDERWDFLIKLFWEQFTKIHRLTDDTSSLCILLESGITVSKLPFWLDGEDCKKDDPLQHEPLCTFASRLLPCMLPNGYACIYRTGHFGDDKCR